MNEYIKLRMTVSRHNEESRTTGEKTRMDRQNLINEQRQWLLLVCQSAKPQLKPHAGGLEFSLQFETLPLLPYCNLTEGSPRPATVPY